MKVLPSGSLKVLLINRHEVARNYQRQVTGGPVAMVVMPESGTQYEAFHVVVPEGPVFLDYRQTGVVHEMIDSYDSTREVHRAAFATTGVVEIFESQADLDEHLANQRKQAKAAKPTKKSGEE